MSAAPSSDALYHRLFGHPLMVEQLLRAFVPEILAEGVDFTRMERVNSKFHAQRGGRRRESDIIWRIPLCDGTYIFVYIIIEFQATDDWWMGVRFLPYIGMLWQGIIDENELKKGDKLPPVLPIVLYNGTPRWTAPTALADLIALPPQSTLWPWQPQLCYYLLDEGAFPGDALTRRDNLATLLFRLEQCRDPEILLPLVRDIVDWFRQHPGYMDLRRLFTELLQHATEEPRRRIAGIKIPGTLLEEDQSMLAERVGEWIDQWYAEGKAAGIALGEAKGIALGEAKGIALGEAKGIALGEARGKAEGKAELLLRQIRRRFGPLSDATESRVRSADNGQLDAWSERILDATTLADLFAAPQPH